MMIVIEQVFFLLLIFQVKHFLADYPLQTTWMLGKFRPDWSFFWPLTLHCLVHAWLTAVIVTAIDPTKWWLAVVDFVIHFVMDRIKAGPKYLGRYNVKEKQFWWSLGLDQSVHHLTHYFIIWSLVT